jgi:pimeloyl-ACP methyl ester carboxylesterase
MRMPAPTFDRRPLRRPWAVLVAALTVVLSGCAPVDSTESTETPVSVFESAPCPSPNYPGHPELDLGSEFSCGFLSVPESRANPGGRKIKIAVARARAQSPSPRADPLVYLIGGPGGSAVASAVPLTGFGLNRDRDVIFIDQRGTLHSDPLLSCPEIDHFMDDSAGMSVQAQSTADKDLDAVRACRTRLASDGYDLSAYNTTENAADIADLRTALKIDQWNIYGVSYGSDLALQLLRDHPEGIRSVVVDSLLPPQTNALTQWWPNAAEGLRAIFDACAAQQGCAAAYPVLSQEFTTAVQRLAKAPLSVEVPPSGAQPGRRVVIDGYRLANLVVQASLTAGSYATLPQTIHAVANGDGIAAARTVLAAIPPPGGGYGLIYGVFCREDAALTDPAAALAAARQALPDLPVEVLSLTPQAPRLFDECAIWDVGRADAAVQEPARSNVPVLLLTGTFDAVTPPSQADEAAATLPHSRVVRFPGLGHDVVAASECGRQIMADFLNRPDGYQTRCADEMRPPTFIG